MHDETGQPSETLEMDWNEHAEDADGHRGPERFPVVTICGSMRFYSFMLEAARELTGAGQIVLMPHDASLSGIPNKTATETGRMLDAMHRAKIRMSGSVYVVNIGGYIGQSTRAEIEYATELGIQVHYAAPGSEGESSGAPEQHEPVSA